MVETDPNMDQVSPSAVARIPRSTSSRFMTVACLISYTLLAALVVFQNRTIQSQRVLIHLLFKDRQRSHVSGAAASGHLAAQNQGQSAAQAPSSSPSSQEKSEVNAKAKRNARKSRNRAPGPPAEGADPTDLRRVSISI